MTESLAAEVTTPDVLDAPTRILVVDRTGWLYRASAAIAREHDLEVVGRAMDVAGAEPLAAATRPDVVVVAVPMDLAAALAAVRSIHGMLPQACVVAFAAEPPGSFDPPPFETRSHVLTPREWDVIALIAESLSSGEIAKTLGIETTTVHAHRANLMKKLGVHKVAGLVRWYEHHKHGRPRAQSADGSARRGRDAVT